jgi:hypothetical protein
MTHAHTPSQADGPLTPEDMQKVVMQVLGSAGPDGLMDTDLDAALSEVGQMAMASAAIRLWHANELEFGWRDGGLSMRLTERKAAES